MCVVKSMLLATKEFNWKSSIFKIELYKFLALTFWQSKDKSQSDFNKRNWLEIIFKILHSVPLCVY